MLLTLQSGDHFKKTPTQLVPHQIATPHSRENVKSQCTAHPVDFIGRASSAWNFDESCTVVRPMDVRQRRTRRRHIIPELRVIEMCDDECDKLNKKSQLLDRNQHSTAPEQSNSDSGFQQPSQRKIDQHIAKYDATTSSTKRHRIALVHPLLSNDARELEIFPSAPTLRPEAPKTEIIVPLLTDGASLSSCHVGRHPRRHDDVQNVQVS